MKDPEKGIKELNLEKDKKVFNHCFTGSSVIDWLVSNKSVRNRQEGLMISASLLSEGYLQPAGDLSKNAADGIAENLFLDNPDAFYFFPDSGFFCEDNSSDEDVILKEEFRGVIIKQGCLLKQGEDPLGAIHLRGCVVTSVESNHDGKKSDDENLFEIITADEVHYYLQAAAPKERTEWIKAIQVASRTGKYINYLLTVKAQDSFLLGYTHSTAPVASGLGVLTLDKKAPKEPVGSDLLQSLEVLT
ncbi:pleckstrin [Cricetulus griseus]